MKQTLLFFYLFSPLHDLAVFVWKKLNWKKKRKWKKEWRPGNFLLPDRTGFVFFFFLYVDLMQIFSREILNKLFNIFRSWMRECINQLATSLTLNAVDAWVWSWLTFRAWHSSWNSSWNGRSNCLMFIMLDVLLGIRSIQVKYII